MHGFPRSEAQHVRHPRCHEVDLSMLDRFPIGERPTSTSQLHCAFGIFLVCNQAPCGPGARITCNGLQNLRTKSFGTCGRQISVLVIPKRLRDLLKFDICLQSLRPPTKPQQLKRFTVFGNGITVVGPELQDLTEFA